MVVVEEMLRNYLNKTIKMLIGPNNQHIKMTLVKTQFSLLELNTHIASKYNEKHRTTTLL